MPTDKILLLGAGGHGKVVLDAMLACGVPRSHVEVADDATALHGADFLGAPVLSRVQAQGTRFHVAIGGGGARQAQYTVLAGAGKTPHTVVHPQACVSPSAELGPACFVAARGIVAPAVRLDASVIVNHGAVVDHDCTVGAFSHIAPNATLGGNVHVGQRVLVGAGAILMPGVRVGDDCTIGAGALVTRDVPAGSTWVGVPAAPLQRGRK
jgi:sugar O-acyltransferase (sialic acid O-acetyltransferase NeuD family)